MGRPLPIPPPKWMKGYRATPSKRKDDESLLDDMGPSAAMNPKNYLNPAKMFNPLWAMNPFRWDK